MTELRIRKFDITKINDGSTIFIIGRRATGKTTLVCDILYHKRTIPIGTIISPTEDNDYAYKNRASAPIVFGEYRPEITANIVKRQKMGTSAVDSRAFLIMDNCLYDASWKTDTSMQQIFMNNRTLRLLHIMTVSYGYGLSPAIRQNIDYIFIFRENIMQNLKLLYERYANIFPSFESFASVINALDKYECLVIDNKTHSNTFEHRIFWYKAKIHKPFTLGNQAYKKRCKKRCWIIRDELFDAVDYRN